eukprot:2174256-Alexandrium_andersonii.AAC.1
MSADEHTPARREKEGRRLVTQHCAGSSLAERRQRLGIGQQTGMWMDGHAFTRCFVWCLLAVAQSAS